MYTLVGDIEAYPKFLPWCRSAEVHSRNATTVDASLSLYRGGITKTFTTRNTLYPQEKIELSLLEGPFRHLSGDWTFQTLGGQGCKVSLNLEFQFASKMTDLVFGPFFEDICNSLVDAFTSRAEDVYNENPNDRITEN